MSRISGHAATIELLRVLKSLNVSESVPTLKLLTLTMSKLVTLALLAKAPTRKEVCDFAYNAFTATRSSYGDLTGAIRLAMDKLSLTRKEFLSDMETRGAGTKQLASLRVLWYRVSNAKHTGDAWEKSKGKKGTAPKRRTAKRTVDGLVKFGWDQEKIVAFLEAALKYAKGLEIKASK